VAAPAQLQGRPRTPGQLQVPRDIDLRVEPVFLGNAHSASNCLNFRLKVSKESACSNDGSKPTSPLSARGLNVAKESAYSNEGSKPTRPSSASGLKASKECAYSDEESKAASPLSAREWKSLHWESKAVVSNENVPVNRIPHRTLAFFEMFCTEKERTHAELHGKPSWSDLLSTTSTPMTSRIGSRRGSRRLSWKAKGPAESVPSNEGHQRSVSKSAMDEITQQWNSQISIGEFRPVSNGDRSSSKGRSESSRRSRKDARLSTLRANKDATPIQDEGAVVIIERTEHVKDTTIAHKKDLFVICQELNVPYALGREAARLWRQLVPDATGDVLIKGRMPIKMFQELQGQQLSMEETTAGSSTAEPHLEKKDHITFHEFVQWFFTNGFRDGINIFDESTEQRYLKQVAKTHNLSLLDVELCREKFKQTDLNGNGVIESDEFEILVHSMMGLACAEKLPHARMHTLWSEADIDGDGSLNFEEFMAFWIKSCRGICPVEGFYRNLRTQAWH